MTTKGISKRADFWTSALLVGLAACGGNDDPNTGMPDSGTVVDEADATAEPDAAPPAQMESEPNDGSTVEEFNDVTVGIAMEGAIGTAGDSDVFRFDAAPGRLYQLQLEADDGSPLEVHLTAMDAGRDGSSAGNDYIKIDSPATGAAQLQVLAMGQGGYFAVVRDARNVGGTGGEGSAAHSYSLLVTEIVAPSILPLGFPSTGNGLLAEPGAVQLYSLDGTMGADFIVDVQATGNMDGRMILFSEMTGDWIARNDDRGAGDPNPLLDAFFSASGAMLLVVENIEPTATGFGYQISASTP